MSINIEAREISGVGDFMGDAGVPIEEQEIAIPEEESKKPERQNGDARKNGHHHMSDFEREEAQQRIAAYYKEKGLDDHTYLAFREKGEKDARENNGVHLSMDVVRENLRRMYPSLSKEKPKAKEPVKSNGEDTSGSNGGVHSENKPRDEVDPQLH